MGVTIVSVCIALVDVGTADTIAAVSKVASAGKTARRIGACRAACVAVVRPCGAFVDVGARDARVDCRPARIARAREAAGRVGTVCSERTIVCVGGALVYISARGAVAVVAQVAGTNVVADAERVCVAWAWIAVGGQRPANCRQQSQEQAGSHGALLILMAVLYSYIEPLHVMLGLHG